MIYDPDDISHKKANAIKRSPKTCSQNIATFNLFQANPTFTFMVVILKTQISCHTKISVSVLFCCFDHKAISQGFLQENM